MIFPLILFFEKKNAAEFLLYEENKSWRKKKEEKMKEASVCSSLWSHGNYAKLPLLAAVTNHRVKAEDTKLITFNCCSIPPQFFLWYLPKKKRSKCVILIRRHSGISSHYTMYYYYYDILSDKKETWKIYYVQTFKLATLMLLTYKKALSKGRIPRFTFFVRILKNHPFLRQKMVDFVPF